MKAVIKIADAKPFKFFSYVTVLLCVCAEAFAAPPPAPSLPSTDSDGQYSVGWSGGGTYSPALQERVGSGGSWNTVDSTPSTPHSANKPNGTYYYRVVGADPQYSIPQTVYSPISSIVVSISAPPPPPPPAGVAQNFESSLGWSNTSSKNWTRRSGGTPSGSTGPSSAGQGSHYAYMETSSGHAYSSGDTAILESGSFTSSGSQSVVFKYHMYGSNMGTLYLEIYNGGQWRTLWSRSGQQHSSSNTSWSAATVSIHGYSGTSRLRFRGVAAGGYRGDMAIDDIALTTQNIDGQVLLYTYDALGRLTYVDDNVNENRDFDYDPAGNRTSVTEGSSE